MKRRKVSIIGAGMVGSACAYTLMQTSLFHEIILVDVNKEKAEGEALDIIQGGAFSKPKLIKAGSFEDTAASDITIISAGANQKPGESRLDLMERNVAIFKDIISNTIKFSPDTIFLVVSNPVDILSLITYKLSNFESNRVIGSGTVLDSARLRDYIGRNLNLDPRNIHAYVCGEHGDSEFIHWSTAFIGDLQMADYIKQNLTDFEKLKKESEIEVRNSAGNIINKKGYTNYAVAMAVKRICEAIVGDERAILSISQYDPKNDIYYSIPAIVGKTGKVGSITPKFNKEETDKLNNTISILKSFTKKINIK